MSYQGEVSYQQRGPPERNNYYREGNDNYRSPQQHVRYQRTDHMDQQNMNYRGYDHGHNNQPGLKRDPFSDGQSSYSDHQERFRDDRGRGPPSHRYPETFQRNDQPPRQEPGWERRTNDPNTSQMWKNELSPSGRGRYEEDSYHDGNRYNYEGGGHSRPPLVQNADDDYRHNREYDQRPAYQQQQGGVSSRNNFESQQYGRPNEGPPAPSWQSQDRNQNYPSQQNYPEYAGKGNPPRLDASGAVDYHQNEPTRDQNPSSGYSRTAPADIQQPYMPTRDGRPSYNRPEPSPERRYIDDSYRDPNFRKDNQRDPRAEPPQVLAKTTGGTAVFGVVARVDNSPTRQPAPSSSPTRTKAPPLNSPTRDYAPPYDRYRDSDPPPELPPTRTTQQQHQYHHALTPISEKPSPPSSISSRGIPPESTWPMKQANEGQNQHGRRDESIQSWQTRADRSYQEQHPDQRNRQNYNEPPGPFQDRQPQSMPSRPAYRDYDYTESSGYGSESTHYTDRSYNNEQQRFSDKGQYIQPPQQQQNDDWPRSPTGSYSHSPPKRPQANDYRQMDKGSELHPAPQASQRYHDQQNDSFSQGHYRTPDSYGPPVSIQNQGQFDERQRSPQDNRPASHDYNNRGPPQDNRYAPQDYNNRGPPQDNRYTPQDYNNREQPHPNLTRPHSQSSYMGSHPSQRHVNADSGVEESHVKSVSAARNMFEKQSDPRRPPPAPKPIIAPKPNGGSNVNTRPVPPRPRNLSEGGWGQQQNRNQFNPRFPEGPISPTSPHDTRPQQHPQRIHPSHSQSMDNLDNRSTYQAALPQRQPQHAQSLQNLDERSRHPDHSYQQPDRERPFEPHEHNETYRNSYTGPAEERPMVLAVKYHPNTGPSVYTRQDEQTRRDSWEKPQRELDRPRPQDDYRSQPEPSPNRPYSTRNSWAAEPHRSNNQQSYSQDSRNPPPNQQQYSQSQKRNSLNETTNFVPDVVARSYELASQSQQPVPDSQPEINRSSFNNHPRQNERNDGYRQQPQNFRNVPEIKNSPDRWPTPPPPLAQDQPPSSQHPDNRYTDDWRRSDLPPQNHVEHQPRQQDLTQPHVGQPRYAYQQEPQGYRSENASNLQMPTQPQQPYPCDSESSEVDVDAPTPPPSGKSLRPPYLTNNIRSESPYERNKPVPVLNRNQPDSWRRIPTQPPSGGAPVSPQNKDPVYSKGPAHTLQSKVSPWQSQPSETKSPPPQKPQRNSTNMPVQSPGLGDERNDFDFTMGATQQLKHPSSRERQRLGKSGALANRKPPSRNNSSSNLLKIENDIDNDYQIEVTDSDISSKANKFEVHREESMRILREAKKEKESSPALPTLSENPKQRASQRVVAPPSDQESEHSTSNPSTSAKKGSTKLVFKKPPAEAAKTIPMPEVTEPASQATRRPPTYLGFGYTPEKPKADLLTQFKSARDSAMRTASEKQDRAMKSVSALVKFSHGKKEPKSPPKPKLTPAEKNAKLLDKMHVEIREPPEEDDRGRHSRHHRDHDDRSNAVRSSVRSSSTVRPEKYDGDDDTTNGSRYERDRKGRGRDRGRDTERGKSRGRSTSRGRNLSPDDRGRSRHRSKSRERSLSPEERRRPRRDFDDRRYDERRHHGEDPPYRRRPPTPDRHHPRDDDRYYPRSPPRRQYPQPYDRHRAAREPDWVEQFRRGREASNHPSRRAWVHDPRRVEVTVGGRRRELDMDAFEREVKRATSYNSDFEQPEPRRQMIPAKLSSKAQQNAKRQPPGDWMNALKERNKNAAKTRFGHVSRY